MTHDSNLEITDDSVALKKYLSLVFFGVIQMHLDPHLDAISHYVYKL